MKTCIQLSLAVSIASIVFTASGQFNGNPVGGPGQTNDSVVNDVWMSTLNPLPAISQATCPWIANGLAAQGFTASNGWTINYMTLKGSLSLESYFAWVTKAPTGNINGGTFGGNANGTNWGGADIRLLYTPGAGDPTGTNVHWMQAILTDSVLNTNVIANAYNASSIYGAGYYEYLDNAGTYGSNPNYDNNYPNAAANPTSTNEFLDIPSRFQPPTGTIHWQAQAFIDTFNPTTKTVDIYGNGVWWGFNLSAMVPEPSTFALMGLGLGGIFVGLRRRKQGAAFKPKG